MTSTGASLMRGPAWRPFHAQGAPRRGRRDDVIRRDVRVVRRPSPRAACLSRHGPERAQLGGLLGSGWGQLLVVRGKAIPLLSVELPRLGHGRDLLNYGDGDL
jgi:hypothetical protein